MKYTNVTSTDGPNPDYVKTTVTFKGGPYPMTAGTYITKDACMNFSANDAVSF
jgi:hypothetical protein